MRMPFDIGFNFPDAAENTRNQAVQQVPCDVAVYGIAIFASEDIVSTFYGYTLEIINYRTGQKLMDEPIQNLTVQSDCRTLWELPSKWCLRANDRILVRLNVFDDSVTTSYQVSLLGHTITEHPNPGRTPFLYSFPMNLGFQDNVTVASGLTSVSFNQHSVGSCAKQMLSKFELCALTLDVSGFRGLSVVPNFCFQVTIGQRKLFDRPVLNSGAGGGTTTGQALTTISGFPNNNVLQYKLPGPICIPQGELVRVDIFPSPTYLSTTQIHDQLDEQCNLVLIGNHLAA